MLVSIRYQVNTRPVLLTPPVLWFLEHKSSSAIAINTSNRSFLLSVMNPAIDMLEHARAVMERKNILVVRCVQVISWPHLLRSSQLQIIAPPPQACAVGGCITLSASPFTPVHPSLWNRVNLHSSDHMTFFQSPASTPKQTDIFFFPISLADIYFLRLQGRSVPISRVLFLIVRVEMFVLISLRTVVSAAFLIIWALRRALTVFPRPDVAVEEIRSYSVHHISVHYQ